MLPPSGGEGAFAGLVELVCHADSGLHHSILRRCSATAAPGVSGINQTQGCIGEDMRLLTRVPAVNVVAGRDVRKIWVPTKSTGKSNPAGGTVFVFRIEAEQ